MLTRKQALYDWRDDAACKDLDVGIFFPENPHPRKENQTAKTRMRSMPRTETLPGNTRF